MTSESDAGEPADILLVEDNPGDIRLTKVAFKDGKIRNTLHVVEDGVDALEDEATEGVGARVEPRSNLIGNCDKKSR